MLTDSHAHLDYDDFAADLPEALQRARDAGVTRVVTIGTDLESCRRAVALAESHAGVFAVVGIHPTVVQESWDPAWMDEVRVLAGHPRVVAIGETGLDYHRLPGAAIAGKEAPVFGALQAVTAEDTEAAIADGAAKAAQAEAFRLHLELAAELGLNVVVHQRDAWSDTLEGLRPFTGKLRAVFHCFAGTADDAAELRALGHLVSFTGIVTFPKAQQVQEAAVGVPDDGYMVETDCPYLAPVPHRGSRCEPAHVRLVAEKIAALRGQSLESVARCTEGTAEAFFRFAR